MRDFIIQLLSFILKPKKELTKTSPLENTNYVTWKKGETGLLSNHFSKQELSCKCSFSDCIEQRISKQLLKNLEALRLDVGGAIVITSAFRCAKHQKALRKSGIQTAVGQSTHELGDAVDVQYKDLQRLYTFAEHHFEAIGTANTFLHLDTRSGKKRRWKYA